MSVPLADASGAVVVTKKMFDSLPGDLQEILVRNGRKHMKSLTEKSREENAAAITAMKKHGINVIDVTSKSTLAEFVAAGKKARTMLVGDMYDKAFLDRVEKCVADFRSKQGTSQ
jgi:TRAP-type C4-dicarboxylate transport system substrate-binding protein